MRTGWMRNGGSRRYVWTLGVAAVVLGGLVQPLTAAERRFLVILANSPKQFPGTGQPPEGLPPFAQINNQYFDKTPGNSILSFAEYWEEISYGDVTISGQTTDWIVLPWPIQPPAGNRPDAYLNMNALDGPNFRYGAAERFHNTEAMHNIDRDGDPNGADNGPFNANRQPGGSDFTPSICNDTCAFALNGRCDDGRFGGLGLPALCARGTDCADCGPSPSVPVWMPGHRFLDMDGDGRWDGLDEATNQMDWDGDGQPDLLGPWVDLDGNGEPNNPSNDCVYLRDSNNDGLPDCCPMGPGMPGCEIYVDHDNNPGTPRVYTQHCGAVTFGTPGGEATDCNGNLIPDACDIAPASGECQSTGFDCSVVSPTDGLSICGRSLDVLPLSENSATPPACTQTSGDGTPDECQFLVGSANVSMICWFTDANGVPTTPRNVLCTGNPSTRGSCPAGQICHFGCTVEVEDPTMTPCGQFPGQRVCAAIPQAATTPRCEFHDVNRNGQIDIVEPFESFLRIGDHRRRDQFDAPDPGTIIDGNTPEGAQYIMDNYPGDPQKVINQSIPKPLFGMIDPMGKVPASAAGQLRCADGSLPVNMTGFPRPVCKAGEHIAFTSPDRWFDVGTTKVQFDKVALVQRTPQPSWYQQAWRDRYDAGGCNGPCDPPPWDATVERAFRYSTTERRYFSANRGGLFGDGSGWIPAANATVVFTTDFFEDTLDRRILPEEVNGIGQPIILFDGFVEHDDLPSSKYHRAGDKRLGEVTSPYNNDPWGQDLAPLVARDNLIQAGGPYATRTHGDLNTDAGNVQNMELLTWRTGVDRRTGAVINPPPSFNNGVAWEGQYGPGLHPYAGPSGLNLGFRDYNLDGLIDQGEIPPPGSDNYLVDTDNDIPPPGTNTRYPWNRRRLLEDCMEVLDQILDLDDYVDQVSLARVNAVQGATFALKPPQFSTMSNDIVQPNGVLSGIVLLSSGSHDDGDFLIAPRFYPIHNQDNNDPTKSFPSSPHGGERIHWNLFVHDLVIAIDDTRSATAFQSGYSAHEYLHSWEGFPDLYDYDIYAPSPQPPINTPVGRWDIMAGSGQVPIGLVHPVPILKEKPGTQWIKPVDLTTVLTPGVDSTITLPRSEFVRDNSHFFLENEDFLGERYYFWNVGAGFNQVFMPGSGMLVLHTNVGANPDALPSGQQNATNFDYLIVQADGLHQLESGISPFGDAGDPFPGSTNKRTFDCTTNPASTWYNPSGQCSGLSVKDVVPDGQGNIAVTFNWQPTNIPSLSFVDPPGGTSVTVSPTIERYKSSFIATDVFGGTTIRLFYIREDTNDLAKLKTAMQTNQIGQLNKLTPGRLQLSMDWNIHGLPDGLYYLFAELVPGAGAGGTERRFTNPRAGRNNVGNGTLTNVNVDIAGRNARSETWSLVCTKTKTPTAPSEWAVTSSLTQPAPASQADQTALAGTLYTSRNGAVSFQINDGTTPFVVGDTFTFVTTGITAISEPVNITAGVITENPIARIIASPLAGDSPLTVNFDARTSTDPSGQQNLTYAWNFGDGQTAAGPVVAHTFTGARTFTVVLTVTNTTSGRSGTASVDIALTNNSPTAVITAAPTSGAQPFTTNFSAANSSDPETPANQLLYRWDFGDGTSVSTGVPGQSINVSKFYGLINNQPTTYVATLTVTDPGGKSGTASVTILVGNSLPVPVITFTALSGFDPLTVEFNAIGSMDADGDAINVTWMWGDGTPNETFPLTGRPPATNGAVQHTFRLGANETTRTFNVTAVLTDARGGQSNWPGVQVTVNRPGPGASNPRAIFTIDPDPPILNQPFTADGSLSFDRPNNTPVASYSWDWGDGTPLSTGARPMHTYTQPGTYTITLTVRDAETPPNSGSATKTVIVSSGGGNGGTQNRAPTAAFTATPAQGPTSTVFVFDASDSSDPDGDPLTFRWTLGDTTIATGVRVEHQYAAAGNYVVRLTVRDDSNASSDTARTIVVTDVTGNRAPVALIGTGPRSGPAPLTLMFNGQNSFDPDGDALTHTWEFRQGTTLIGTQVGDVITRRFDAVGVYTVELVVSDGELENRTAPETITVTQPVPDDGGGETPRPNPDEPAPLPVRPGGTICGLGIMTSLLWCIVGLAGIAVGRSRRSATHG